MQEAAEFSGSGATDTGAVPPPPKRSDLFRCASCESDRLVFAFRTAMYEIDIDDERSVRVAGITVPLCAWCRRRVQEKLVAVIESETRQKVPVVQPNVPFI